MFHFSCLTAERHADDNRFRSSTFSNNRINLHARPDADWWNQAGPLSHNCYFQQSSIVFHTHTQPPTMLFAIQNSHYFACHSHHIAAYCSRKTRVDLINHEPISGWTGYALPIALIYAVMRHGNKFCIHDLLVSVGDEYACAAWMYTCIARISQWVVNLFLVGATYRAGSMMS